MSRCALVAADLVIDDGRMTSQVDQTPKTQNGRVLGWISGLGLLVGPWLAAGILSTFMPEPENAFPWALLGATVVAVGWLIVGSVRIADFRSGAIRGSAISVSLVAVLYVTILLRQP